MGTQVKSIIRPRVQEQPCCGGAVVHSDLIYGRPVTRCEEIMVEAVTNGDFKDFVVKDIMTPPDGNTWYILTSYSGGGGTMDWDAGMITIDPVADLATLILYYNTWDETANEYLTHIDSRQKHILIRFDLIPIVPRSGKRLFVTIWTNFEDLTMSRWISIDLSAEPYGTYQRLIHPNEWTEFSTSPPFYQAHSGHGGEIVTFFATTNANGDNQDDTYAIDNVEVLYNTCE